MTKRWILVAALGFSAANLSVAQHQGAADQGPFNLAQPNPQAQVVPPEVFRQIGSQDAALRAIDFRLGTIDEHLKEIQGTLDHDVMPTIHVFDFLKWLFALIVAAIVGVGANNLLKRQQPRTPGA